jgi:serine/threonine-protein kinase
MAGTPEYIAPEQISSFANVTAAADIYAMGVVTFEVVTGRVPFHHTELMPLLQMHLNEEPPSARSINPSLPVALDMTILQALQKDPAARFENIEQLGKTLAALRKELLP